MNEEEKKAIEYFKDLDISFNTLLRIDLNGFRNAIQLVLNLIENQQKEIEELKNKIKDSEIVKREINIKWAEKIRDKAEELEITGSLEDDIASRYFKEFLKELLKGK